MVPVVVQADDVAEYSSTCSRSEGHEGHGVGYQHIAAMRTWRTFMPWCRTPEQMRRKAMAVAVRAGPCFAWILKRSR